MAFNKDEMHAPKWMDSAFFEKVLRHSESDAGLTVDASIKIVPGTKPGDHYASIIFRAGVSFKSRGKDREVSLIVKTIPEQEGMKRDILKDGEIFETETVMYQSVIPEMKRLLQSAGDDTDFGPRLLYSSKEPTRVMVFEDLTKRDYQMKYTQLNLDEAKIVYAKLARWHAASMYLSSTMPLITKLDKSLGNMMQNEFSDIWVGHMATLAKLCRGWPGYESFGDRLDTLKGTIFEKLNEIYKAKDSNLINVLNHGDLHSKNMMFKIEDGVTKDILLLDYQISSWGSPGTDIIYSLYNTCSIETRENHRDELIKFYHDEFTAALNKFGYLKKIPSLIDLHVEVLKCGYLETFLSCTFLPFMILPFDEMLPKEGINPEEGFDLDFADKEKMTEMMTRVFQHPAYVAVIQRYLPAFLYKGLLDA